MAENSTAPEATDRVAIGITFGNSNGSIAYTVDDKAEVIANEDGGTLPNSHSHSLTYRDGSLTCLRGCRPSDPCCAVLR